MASGGVLALVAAAAELGARCGGVLRGAAPGLDMNVARRGHVLGAAGPSLPTGTAGRNDYLYAFLSRMFPRESYRP